MRANSFLSVLVMTLLCLPKADADVVAVATLPQRAQLLANTDASIAMTWQVTVDNNGDPGATSAIGTFVNATTGAPLEAIRSTVGSQTGRGVLSFPELVTIDGAQIAAWLAQGIRRVGYRRTFDSPGSIPRTGQLLFTLSGSGLEGTRDGTSAQLQVLRMELTFASGKRIELVEDGARLLARLTVGYGGSGTLRGRWQVAEPGGGSTPFFRTLGLIRETFAPVQRAVLESPVLPTHARGRYVLRFCLEAEDSAAEECADSSSSVQTFYEVADQDGVAEIRGLQPSGLAANAGTAFRWTGVPGATTYQLQIFQPGTPDPSALLAEEPAGVAERDLRFVTGMLITGDAAQTELSSLVRSHLERGQRYLWRVTAHDLDGRLVARSPATSFVYQP